MNSLTELNGYASALSFTFTDNRIPNVLFDVATPVNQSQFVDEGFSFNSSVGIEILEILNATESHPTYSINVFSLAGATVSWASLPSGVTVSNPSTGVYTLSGLSSKAQWDAVKYASISMPTGFNGLWTYTSTIAYYSQTSGNQTKAWTTAVTVNDVVFLTTPLQFSYTASTTALVTNGTQIVNVDASYPGVTWTVVGTPNANTSISTWTTTGTGGSFSVNSSTKVFTIVGTRAQVNSRLAGLTLTTNAQDTDFSVTYAVSNGLNGITDSAVQTFASYNLTKLKNASTIYFIEDAVYDYIEGVPEVADTPYDGTGTYTLRITPSTTAAISTLTSEPLAKTIVNQGAAITSTAQFKFDTASLFSNATTNSYISVTNDLEQFNFGSSNFTIDFWIRIPAQAISGGVMGKISSSSYGSHLGWSIVLHDGYIEFVGGLTTPTNFSPLVGVSRYGITSRLSADTWTHIAFSCNNNVLSTYKNGVREQQTSMASVADSTGALNIGKGYYWNDGAGNSAGTWRETWTLAGQAVQGTLSGYLDEIRVSNIARYTEAVFVPYTEAYTWDANTRLLIHANGTNSGTSFSDDVAYGSLIGTNSFNNSTKVITLSGTRSQINARRNFLRMTNQVDWANDFTFSYLLTTPRDETATKVQSILCASNDTEITNMNETRAYFANRPNQIFSSTTPYISDFDNAEGNTYTIGFASALGQFAFGTADVPVDSLTFSGTKSQCTAKFNSVRFYPTVAVYANGTFTYTQIKNGVTQISQSVALTGTYAVYNNTRTFLITTSGTYTPTPADVKYGDWELALVGGGGTPAAPVTATSPFTAESHGGGGGGEVIQQSNSTITNQTYSITVGAAGNVYPASNQNVSDGGDTIAFGLTARGGKKGIHIASGLSTAANNGKRTGGASGNGNLGGLALYSTTYQGGGGGGAGDTKNNATFVSEINHNGYNVRTGYPNAGTKTYTNISTTTITGTGTGATFNISIPGSETNYAAITITISNAGTGYSPSDTVRILSSQIENNASDIIFVSGQPNTQTNSIVLTISGVGNLPKDATGGKGVYIAWEASANSMYGWYGGGGGGGLTNNDVSAGGGAIGNLISNPVVQSNGITFSKSTGYYNNSGGGGTFSTNMMYAGSGVIGVKITSKG